MCGIFGVLADKSKYEEKYLSKLLERLAILSETRGKESSGFAFKDYNASEINVVKGAIIADKIIKTEIFKNYLKSSVTNKDGKFVAIGHSRLVTNGSQLNDNNNQPVIKDGVVGVHNGIIVNVDELWLKHNDLKRLYDVDTEILFSLITKYLHVTDNLEISIKQTFDEVFGTVSTLFLFNNNPYFGAFTNNGSLYKIVCEKEGLSIFASEHYILAGIAKEFDFEKNLGQFKIEQVKPNSGLFINTNNLHTIDINFSNPSNSKVETLKKENTFKFNIKTIKGIEIQRDSLFDLKEIRSDKSASIEEKLLEYNKEEILALKRCTKCLLPETFPFIEYDDSGECNYCKNYVKKEKKHSKVDLENIISKYRSNNGSLDCIVPFSGGRDSSYSLHYIKKELGLNPITLTYDWGMVTDLARRNIARLCGKLGVENIVISADIKRKREHIRKNVSAWLKKPELGMIPLFMAGDKAFHYYVIELKKRTGIKLNLWGTNPLESTDFKTGFCGAGKNFNKEKIYSLSVKNQMILFSFILKNFMTNFGYINNSLPENILGFLSRQYFKKEDYYDFYDYFPWNETEMIKLLRDEYDWELASDTSSTWRIGDGTAPFYNYIYYTVVGFSEFDTFRSNQIREGIITREEGLKHIENENAPRYESIKWYLSIIGLDFGETIKKINCIKKLYRANNE